MDGKEAIKRMFLVFGNHDIARAKIYTEELNQFPDAVVSKACQKAIYEQKYNAVPTLAEIITAIKSLIGETKPDARTKEWAEAWQEIDSLMRKYGCTGKEVQGSTPEITQTIKAIGGIDVLATCPANDFNTMRAQVRRMYDDVCKRAAEKQINEYVLGGNAQLLQGKVKAIGRSNGDI